MLKNTRFFLAKDADSFIKLEVPRKGEAYFILDYTLTLADCYRRITWSFVQGSKSDLEKCRKICDLTLALYEELESHVSSSKHKPKSTAL